MMDKDRALAPLDAVSAAIDSLETYRTPQELAESLQAIGQAVERCLRQLLRADTSSPDELRLVALSQDDLPTEHLITTLRDHRIISPDLARMVNEMLQSIGRATDGTVRAADADAARDTVQRLRDEMAGAKVESPVAPLAPVAPPAQEVIVIPQDHAAYAGPAARAAAASGSSVSIGSPTPTPPVEKLAPPAEAAYVQPRRRRRNVVLPVGVLAALALVGWLVFHFFLSGADAMENGIKAFEQKRWGIAEQSFRAAIAEDGDNVTARLYLGRVLFTQGRSRESVQVLNDARKRAPRDADVLRNLGHALMDLKQPAAAVSAYRQAQELEPADADNWVGLVRALRAAGDPSAEETMRRAPAEAQATLRPKS
ncbi:MAG: tetratricopeptide repeat protein [Longimicrobiales bacterium]